MKKLVLVIVEGPSDEILFSVGLGHFFSDYVLRFIVYKGDLTANGSVKPTNVKISVVDLVKNYLKANYFRPSDLAFVLQIVDIDACFLGKKHIIEDLDNGKIRYTDEGIITSSVDNIFKRNQNKSANITKLIAYDYLNIEGHRIDYDIYYNCINLEHVFYNKHSLSSGSKKKYALDFAFKEADDISEFINIIKTTSPPSTSYKESWDYLRIETNCLKRLSNISYLLDKLKNKLF